MASTISPTGAPAAVPTAATPAAQPTAAQATQPAAAQATQATDAADLLGLLQAGNAAGIFGTTGTGAPNAGAATPAPPQPAAPTAQPAAPTAQPAAPAPAGASGTNALGYGTTDVSSLYGNLGPDQSSSPTIGSDQTDAQNASAGALSVASTGLRGGQLMAGMQVRHALDQNVRDLKADDRTFTSVRDADKGTLRDAIRRGRGPTVKVSEEAVDEQLKNMGFKEGIKTPRVPKKILEEARRAAENERRMPSVARSLRRLTSRGRESFTRLEDFDDRLTNAVYRGRNAMTKPFRLLTGKLGKGMSSAGRLVSRAFGRKEATESAERAAAHEGAHAASDASREAARDGSTHDFQRFLKRVGGATRNVTKPLARAFGVGALGLDGYQAYKIFNQQPHASVPKKLLSVATMAADAAGIIAPGVGSLTAMGLGLARDVVH